MSTSIAALPAYRTSKAERTEARANRTIFGTTLDNSTKAQEVLRDEKVISSADQLHKSSKKWRTPTPKKQALLDAAWGIKDYSQAEIGEEQIRSYSKISFSDTVTSSDQFAHHSISTVEEEEQDSKASSSLLVAYKDRFGVYNVGKSKLSAGKRSSNSKNSARPLGKPRSNPRKRRLPLSSMSDVTNSTRSKQSNTPQIKTLQVPKFPLPPGKRNYLRTASLKITETGAKDLINSRSVNKVGLGGTTQFNHESFKKREAPNQYVDHGNVFSLGQKGHSLTTNSEVTGPGGFYKLSTTDSNNSKSVKDDGDSMYFYSMPYEPSISSSRRTHDASAIRNQAKAKMPDKKSSAPVADFEEVVPLNILHKYGANEVRKLLSGKESEVEGALEKASESSLSHSGMVPPRTNVPELNHPINPPATYYSNFGQSLKYDKFEGGLHLYIN